MTHVTDQINNTVGVTPFVIIPRDNLEEALFVGKVVLESSLRVIDGRTLVMDEVSGDEFFLSESKNTTEISGGGTLQEAIDFLDVGVAGSGEGEIDNGDVGSGDTEGHTGELTLGGGEDFTDGLGGTSGGGDDVAGGSATTTPVLGGGTINSALSGSVSVDGSHETSVDTDVFLHENVDEGSEAVGGAGSVGDDVVGSGIVFVVVDSHNEGLDATLGRGGDDDLLGTSLDVTSGLFLFGEETSGFDDVVNAELTPGEVSRVALSLDALDAVTVDDEDVLLAGRTGFSFDAVLEATVNGVVLHLVSEVVSVGFHINDSDDVEFVTEETLITDGLEDHTADTTETIDTNVKRHF